MPPDENTGAASPAPPTSPDTSTPAPASTPEPSPGSEFGGLGTDFDDEVEVDLTSAGDDGAPKPAEAAPATEEPAKPAPPPAQAPQPAPASAAAPPAQGQKESQPSAASPPSEPRTLVEQIQQHRGDIINELARTRFAWDPGEQKEFMEALETDASKALVDFAPRMMARMYYESATMALNHINQFVPVLIGNYTKLMDQQKAAEDTFFKQFPGLNKQAHWNDIVQFAGMLNRQNPNLSQADLLSMVGAAVMAKNRIAPTVNGGAPPPRKPSTPAFVPAQAGGNTARVVKEPESPYAGLGGDYD